MQTPQDLDAQHGGELSRQRELRGASIALPAGASLARDAAKPAFRNSVKTGSGTVVRQTGIENSFAGRKEF
jgi:hypothetical protein